MNKQNIKNYIQSLNDEMNDISVDFANDYTQEIRYLSDCFMEFADSRCPVYYNQVNEECTDKMIDEYLSEFGTFEVKYSSDIDKLKMYALANDYIRRLYEDKSNIKKCVYAALIMEDEKLLNAVENMNESEFDSVVDCMADNADESIQYDDIYQYLDIEN